MFLSLHMACHLTCLLKNSVSGIPKLDETCTSNPHVSLIDEKWAPFPTYPVVLGFKGRQHTVSSHPSKSLTEQCIGDSQDVNLFSDFVAGRGERTPGLPKFDPNRVVHGSQSIEILKPLPKESGAGWKITSRIVGVHENSAYSSQASSDSCLTKNFQRAELSLILKTLWWMATGLSTQDFS